MIPEVEKQESGTPSATDIMNKGNVVKIKTKAWRYHLLNSVYALQRDDFLCDVSIELENEEAITCHSCVLAGASPYFKDRFSRHLRNADGCFYFQIDSISFNTMEYIMAFLYKGEVDIPKCEVKNIRHAAMKLQLSTLDILCETLDDGEDIEEDSQAMAPPSASQKPQNSNLVESTTSASRRKKNNPTKFIKPDPDATISSSSGSHSDQLPVHVIGDIRIERAPSTEDDNEETDAGIQQVDNENQPEPPIVNVVQQEQANGLVTNVNGPPLNVNGPPLMMSPGSLQMSTRSHTQLPVLNIPEQPKICNPGAFDVRDAYLAQSLGYMDTSQDDLMDTSQVSLHQIGNSNAGPIRSAKKGKRASGFWKRERTNFSPDQVGYMQRYFKQTPLPNNDQLIDIHNATGLARRVIQVWFQNSRARLRRRLERGAPVDPDQNIQALMETAQDHSSRGGDISANDNSLDSFDQMTAVGASVVGQLLQQQ